MVFLPHERASGQRGQPRLEPGRRHEGLKRLELCMQSSRPKSIGCVRGHQSLHGEAGMAMPFQMGEQGSRQQQGRRGVGIQLVQETGKGGIEMSERTLVTPMTEPVQHADAAFCDGRSFIGVHTTLPGAGSHWSSCCSRLSRAVSMGRAYSPWPSASTPRMKKKMAPPRCSWGS